MKALKIQILNNYGEKSDRTNFLGKSEFLMIWKKFFMTNNRNTDVKNSNLSLKLHMTVLTTMVTTAV